MKALLAISSAAFLALSGPVFAQSGQPAPQGGAPSQSPPSVIDQASTDGLDAFGQAPGGGSLGGLTPGVLIGGGALIGGAVLIGVAINNNKSSTTTTTPASP